MFGNKRRLPERQRPVVELLEPRVLYSAELTPAALTGGALLGPAEHRLLDQPVEARAVEVMFVDTATPDYQALINDITRQAGAGRDIEVILLDGKSDGIGQITEALSGRSDVSAVHIIAHGAAGSVQLGAGTLDAQSLHTQEALIASWRGALSADADLLIYGCDVAGTAEGRALIDALAGLTGADVAASTDNTGHAALGGNWDLEYRIGAIEAHLALSQEAQDEWFALLAQLTVDTTNDVLDGDTSSIAALQANRGADGQISLREAIIASNATAGADEVILQAGTYRLTLHGASEDAAATGDLDITDHLTLRGAGAALTLIDGDASDRVLSVLNKSTVTFSDLTIQNGTIPASGLGSALYISATNVASANTVVLDRVIVQNNVGGSAAIYNAKSNLTITDSTLQGNQADKWGGALYNDGGAAILTRVTVSNNVAAIDGGGIYSFGGSSSLALTNVTISGNQAPAGLGGGLITNRAATIVNSTIAFNSAASGGGVYLQNPGSVTLKNTILAQNTGGNANTSLTSQGSNIDSDGTAGLTGLGDQSGTAGTPIDARLGPLQDNGGFTATHALLAGSPAINAGTTVGAPTVDQRNLLRDAQPDIGAYEVLPNAAPVNNVPGAQTINEDSALVFRAANGNAITIADPDAGLGALQVTLSVANGTLTLGSLAGLSFTSGNGVANQSMTFAGTLASLNAALAGLRYVPTANYNGPDLLTITTNDQGNSGTGGALSATSTVAINVAALNDAPVLSGANNLAAINEDPLVNPGTLVSALIAGQVSDVDAGALSGIAVTAVDNSNGTWQFSTDGGAIWSDFGTPSEASARLLAADASTFVRFVPNANFNGTVTNGLSFRAWDGTSGVTGATADATVNGDDTAFSTALAGSSLVVTPVNDAPVGAPSIAGTVTEDQVLTADTSGVSDDDGLGAFSYQWLRGGAAIAGATASTYTLGDADVGAAISVVAGYTDAQGTAESVGSAAVGPIANVNDAPTGAVSISGTPTEDQVLTAINALADADGLGPISYQWQRNGVNVAGATAGTYTLGDADVGTAINVVASYIDGYGTAESVPSVNVGPIININDVPVGVPSITGTPTENQVLTANTSGISDDDGLGAFSYRWLRNGVNIAGATASTYTLGDADVGAQISVQVSYTDAHGTNEGPLTSAQTAAVANVNDAPVGAPSIAGTVAEDQVLAANTSGIGDADGLGAFSYQWLRGGVAIAGATASTYTLGDADVGALMSVRVSYTDGQGTAESVTSAQTAAVANLNDTPVGVPTISGTVTEDQVLTADTTGISDADGLGVFSYQWLRDAAVIGGATASTYTLGDADVGALMSVRVSYTDAQGAAEGPLTSVQTAAVTNINDAPTGAVSIAGIPTEAQVLTASNTLADADGLGAINYQWQRNGVNIAGAAASTYTLVGADVGTTIRVVASYTDGHGTAESVSSTGVGPIANLNFAPVGVPTVTGTVTEDQVLTADTTGISDANGLGAFNYQWLRNNVAIGGATASTYTLGDADVGALISVQVSYTDAQGTAEGPLTSVQTAAVANINDAPLGTANSVALLQDGSYTFGAADFGFSDPNDNPANSLLAVRITTIPGAGTLTDNGVAVTPGQFVSAADIGAGLLVFTPPAGASGTFAGLSFQVQDDGGGADLDGNARALTLNVNATGVIVLPPAPDPIVPPPSVVPPPTPEPSPPQPEEDAAATPAAIAPRSTGGADIFAFDVAVAEGSILPPLVSREALRAAVFTVGLRTFSPVSLPVSGAAEAVAELRLASERLLQTVQLTDVLRSANRPESLANEIDELRDALRDQGRLQQGMVGAVAFGSLSLTVGYVLWMVRGGVLVASVLSTLPAWRVLDPLPVLAQDDEDQEQDAEVEEDDVAFQAFLDEGAR